MSDQITEDIRAAFAEVNYADGELAAVGAKPRVFRALARARLHLARALGEEPSVHDEDCYALQPTSADKPERTPTMMVGPNDERVRNPSTTPTEGHDPRTLTLAEVLAGAERATERVKAWPQWKQDIGRTEEPQADPWALPDGWGWGVDTEQCWYAERPPTGTPREVVYFYPREDDTSHDGPGCVRDAVALRNRTDPPKTEEPTP